MCYVCEMPGLGDPLKAAATNLPDIDLHVTRPHPVNGVPAFLLTTGEELGGLVSFRTAPAWLAESVDSTYQDDGIDWLIGNAELFNTGDVPGDSSTGATVTVGGGSVSGAIEVGGDRDWFRVDLAAGQTYTFATGPGTTGEMDTILSVRDANGTELAFNDDSVGLLSSITFTAPSSGTYFLDVGGFSTLTGTYTLSAAASAPPPPDSVPGDSTTTATVAVGGSTAGEIGAAGDQDWFGVSLVAGQTYRFSTSPAASGTTISDANLVLRNAGGAQVDVDTTGNTASILFTAATSGTYFLDVSGANGATGGYTLNAVISEPLPVVPVDQIARHLTHDFWGGSPHRFNVAPGGTLTVKLTGLSSDGLFLAREALALWTDVTGILFSEVTGSANITFDDDESGAFARVSFSGGITSSAEVNIGTDWVARYGASLNSYSFQTYIHEIGHALGLGHGGFYNGEAGWDNDARFRNDAWVTTIMSYFDVNQNTLFDGLGFTPQFVVTPMVSDVVATASLYGAATGTRLANTTYGFNNNSGRAVYDAAAHPGVSYTIHDHGGIDTLDYSGFSASQRIDLHQEVFSNVGGRVGNVIIARGSVIENAVGGSGNDTLIGNSANNLLVGNGGTDTAVFGGNVENYRLSFMVSGRYVVRGPEGYDLTVGVEQLRFGNSIATGPTAMFNQGHQLASKQFGASASAGSWTSMDDFPRMSADVNGDGRADIVGFGSAGTYVALGRANGTFAPMALVSAQFGQAAQVGGWASYDQFPRLLADVNGDGRADVVGFGNAGTYVALANAAGGFGTLYLATKAFGASTASGGWESQNIFQRTLADVNGDGRADIVGFGNLGTYVALARADGKFDTLKLATASFGRDISAGGWDTHDHYPRMLADVNGDGRADIVGFGEAATYVAYGNASGGFGTTSVLIDAFGASPRVGGWVSQDRYPRDAVDVNGDGRADIVGFGEAGVYYALNNGSGGFGALTLGVAAFGASAAAGTWSSADRYPRTLADVNGDGYADIIGFGDAGVLVTLATNFTYSTLQVADGGSASSFGSEAAADSPPDPSEPTYARKADIWFDSEEAYAFEPTHLPLTPLHYALATTDIV